LENPLKIKGVKTKRLSYFEKTRFCVWWKIKEVVFYVKWIFAATENIRINGKVIWFAREIER